MKYELPQIRHNKAGFEVLAHFHAEVRECFFSDIGIDMQKTSWFDADMCAVFGAVLYYLGGNSNSVSLVNICPEVERILSKNGFLSHYGRGAVPDYWETTIPYQRFGVEDDSYFKYIEREIISRSEIPDMSSGFLKKFRESIFEIFSNAVSHSCTKLGIFSCGQLFPKKDQLDFIVADLGIGIRENIKRHKGLDFSSEDAIGWATEGNNTTRGEGVPGGLGLKLLREFIDLNGGRIQIVSDSGYWQRKDRQDKLEPLDYSFPGTVVSIEINTADSHSYMLESDLTDKDIF